MSWASLSLKNLTNALRDVDDWEDLGIQLDIKYHELKKFASEHQGTEKCKRAMLQFWLDHETEASWDKVISALYYMKLNRVAEEVKRKYQMPTSTKSEDVPSLVPTMTAESVPTADPPSATPTDQPHLPPTTKSENVVMIDLSSIHFSDQPLSTQTENIASTASPTVPSIGQPAQSSTDGVKKVQFEIVELVALYDELVATTVESFIEKQEDSSVFFRKLRTAVAVLPTSLKYQHRYFLEHHSSQIAKATTVEEIFSILNRYCNFLNCGLLAHIITKFGNVDLQKKLTNYTIALQAFRSRTKITDFVKTYTGKQMNAPECVTLRAKLGSEWEHHTLEDAEKICKTMAESSSLADYVLYLEKVTLGCIYLSWRVLNHAVGFLAAAMDSKFLQCHCVEEVTIDGVDLEVYKYERQYIFDSPYQWFKVISKHVDELSEGLVWASQEGCLEDVVFLLNTGVEVNSRSQWEGRTALMQASGGGYMEVVKVLLRAQAGVDMQDEYGSTALMWASDGGHTDVVQLLLSSGAQVDLEDENGSNAFMVASGSGHTDVVQLLLSSEAQVDWQDENHSAVGLSDIPSEIQTYLLHNQH